MMPTLAPVALPRCPLFRVLLDPQLVPPSVPATPPALNTLGYPGSHHLHLHCPVRVHFEKPRENTGASLCRESWNNFSLHSLQICSPAKVPYVHGTPPLAPTSFSATLAGHLLCGEPRDHSSTCLLKLSNPARAPSAWRALGSPGLHPLQPQLSCHSATCMERHRTSQPAHCLSSSCSAGEHRAPQDPSLYPLQFQLSCPCALCT